MIRGVHAAIVTHFDDALEVDHEASDAEVARLITGGRGRSPSTPRWGR